MGDHAGPAGELKGAALDAPISWLRDHFQWRIGGLSRVGRCARPDHKRRWRLAEPRTGQNQRHLLVGLLWQSVFGRLAGYEDVNNAERLCRDPAMRWVVGGRRAPMGQAASALWRFYPVRARSRVFFQCFLGRCLAIL
jgi:hypothetical protein